MIITLVSTSLIAAAGPGSAHALPDSSSIKPVRPKSASSDAPVSAATPSPRSRKDAQANGIDPTSQLRVAQQARVTRIAPSTTIAPHPNIPAGNVEVRVASLPPADGSVVPTVSSTTDGYHGTVLSTEIQAANRFITNSDNLDASSARGLSNLYTGMRVDGANARGNRVADTAVISVEGKTGNRYTDDYYYVAQASSAFAKVNDSGTARHPSGNLFGGNDITELRTGSTYWNSITGREIDVEVQSGASVLDKVGVQIVQTAKDRVAGTGNDIALGFANQAGATTGWSQGISFGMRNGMWPFNSSSTLIGSHASAMSDGPSYTALNGIDFTAIRFSGAAMTIADGAKICLNVRDACWYHLGTKLYYDVGGQHMLSIEDGTGNIVLKGSLIQHGTP